MTRFSDDDTTPASDAAAAPVPAPRGAARLASLASALKARAGGASAGGAAAHGISTKGFHPALVPAIPSAAAFRASPDYPLITTQNPIAADQGVSALDWRDGRHKGGAARRGSEPAPTLDSPHCGHPLRRLFGQCP
jgi:hypothetical protein